MFSKNRLYQDLEQFSKSAGCIFMSYNDAHSADAKKRKETVDFFVKQAENVLGKNAFQILRSERVIYRDINGSYQLQCYGAEKGGGSAISMHVSNNGMRLYKCKTNRLNMFFFFDDDNYEDRHNIFHEMAHIIQYKAGIFNGKKANVVLDVADKKFSKSFATQYRHYLRESHANAFACACMLLRAENKKDRAKTIIKAYRRIGAHFYLGMRDATKEYGGYKYYADCNVQRSMIKEVNSWFKNGEVAKYIDGKGNINFELLALKVEEIVHQNAFSPKLFNDFLNENWLSCHSIKEKGWRHEIPKEYFWALINNVTNRDYDHITKGLQRHKAINKKKWDLVLPMLPRTDDDAALLNVCCNLNNEYIKLLQKAWQQHINLSKYRLLDPQNAIRYGKLPESVFQTVLRQIETDKIGADADLIDVMKNYQIAVNNTLHMNVVDRKTAGVVTDLMNQDDKFYDMVWNMYNLRRENPSAAVDLQKMLAYHTEPSEKKQKKYELEFLDSIKQQIFASDPYDNFAESHATAHKMREKIINGLQNPDCLCSSDFFCELVSLGNKSDLEKCKKIRANLDHIHSFYYLDSEIFERTVAKYAKSLHNLNNKNLPKTKIIANQR